AEALLEPTRIYVKSCLAALRTGGVRALAHITGGGLLENLPRVLPEGLGVELNGDAWPVPAVFGWLAEAGDISARNMARTFNCGIGMAVIVAASHAESLSKVFTDNGETVKTIGHVVERGEGGVEIANIEESWPS
ncbi:MAG: phosphoribosylformylglycinamidine cyclo-ligase, partial [Rhodospirillales bacterium]|nr:phosphoribosylformylglycinamidine cyclo-ligase [Rhodospirillales bacterium]